MYGIEEVNFLVHSWSWLWCKWFFVGSVISLHSLLELYNLVGISKNMTDVGLVNIWT
jgi:hypothetical protein